MLEQNETLKTQRESSLYFGNSLFLRPLVAPWYVFSKSVPFKDALLLYTVNVHAQRSGECASHLFIPHVLSRLTLLRCKPLGSSQFCFLFCSRWLSCEAYADQMCERLCFAAVDCDFITRAATWHVARIMSAKWEIRWFSSHMKLLLGSGRFWRVILIIFQKVYSSL